MNPRSTALLALVALVLGAFVWFFQVEGADRRREAEEEAKRLFPGVEQEDVVRIAFTTNDDVPVTLAFGEGGWALVDPIAFPADEAALSGIASNLAQMASEGAIAEPGEAGIYGLGDPAQEVRFTAGDAEHRVRFGNKTPVDYNTYVSVDDGPEIYTVPSFRANALDRSLDDLRERRILRFDRNAVERIDASWPGGGVALERRGEDWWLVSPREVPADATTVDDLLADLSFLRADGFIDDPPAALESGFDDPAFGVVLRTRAGGEEEPRELSLAVGRPVEGAKRAVRGMETALYVIPNERLNDFPRRDVEYRFRTLAQFVASDAERMELEFRPPEGEPVTVTATRGDDGWTSEPEAMASGKAARLVAELARLRADDILADAMGPDELAGVGLDPPRVRLLAWAGEGEGGEPVRLAEVALGHFDSSGIVARAADQETVYRLDFELAEHLPVSLEAFRNRFLSEEEPDEPADGAEEPAVDLELPALELGED